MIVGWGGDKIDVGGVGIEVGFVGKIVVGEEWVEIVVVEEIVVGFGEEKMVGFVEWVVVEWGVDKMEGEFGRIGEEKKVGFVGWVVVAGCVGWEASFGMDHSTFQRKSLGIVEGFVVEGMGE